VIINSKTKVMNTALNIQQVPFKQGV